MASYLPPTEELPIFDNSVFQSNDENITFAQATTEFLRFPTAQGTETFNDPVVQQKIVIQPSEIQCLDYGLGISTVLNSSSITSNNWFINNLGNPYFNDLKNTIVYTIPSPTFDIDLLNIQNLTFSIDMNSKIAGLTFSNGVPNGNYKIYLTGITGEVFYKNSCMNNLAGDTVIGVGSFWILTVYYTGTFYVVDLQNYT